MDDAHGKDDLVERYKIGRAYFSDEKYPLCYCCLFGIDIKDVPVELGRAMKEWMALIDKRSIC